MKRAHRDNIVPIWLCKRTGDNSTAVLVRDPRLSQVSQKLASPCSDRRPSEPSADPPLAEFDG